MISPIRILSTKKLQNNQKQFLLNAGFRLLEADFIQIEYQKVTLDSCNENLIFTSQNAVLSVLKHPNHADLKTQNCFCVGVKTRKILEENGFIVKNSFDYAEGLVDFLMLNHSHENFTFFSGNLRKDTIPDGFKKNNVFFEEKQVYHTKLTPQQIDSKVNGILFFSPSGVQSYLMKHTLMDEICFCIGKTTAKELALFTNNIVVANQPSIENVITQCITHFKA